VGKKEGMSTSTLLATVVLDRLIDGLVFVGVVGFVLTFMDFPATMAKVSGALKLGGQSSLALYIGALALLWLLRFYTEATQRVISTLVKLLPVKWVELVRGIVASFAEGVTLPKNWLNLGLILFYSVLYKLLSASHLYFAGLAYEVALDPIVYLFFMVFLGFLVILAGTLGIIGSFEVGTVVALGFYNVPQEVALSMALIVHVASVATVGLVGFASLWWEGLALKELKQIS